MKEIVGARTKNARGKLNCKAKGSRNERRSIALLQAQGYVCVKSGGSLGAFDVVAIGPKDIILVQVKTRDWPGVRAMEAIRAFVAPSNCRKVVHRWRDRQATPDMKEV